MKSGKGWSTGGYNSQKRLSFEDRLQIAAQLDVSGHTKEADRFVNCGRRVHIFISEQTNTQYGILESCRSRLCDRCSHMFYRKYIRQLKKIIKTMNVSGKKRLSFLTLTFKTRTDESGNRLPLNRSYIRKCIKDVRLFMNCFYGKYSQTWNPETRKIKRSKKYIGCGAFAVLEIGKSGNLHFHALVYGYYRPLKTMSEVWKELTQDSYRIQIDQVGYKTKQTPYLAAKYILKYIQKPPPFQKVTDLVAYGNILKGIRRIHTYGVFWGDPRLRSEKAPLLCPVSGEPLKYQGTAQDGEMILRYYAVKQEADKITRIDAFIDDLIAFGEEKFVWKMLPKGYTSAITLQIFADNVQPNSMYAKRCIPGRKFKYNPNIYERTALGLKYTPKPKNYFYISHNFNIDNLAA
jgi:hypothetical protein